MKPLALYLGFIPMVIVATTLFVSFVLFTGHWLFLSEEDRRNPELGEGRDRGFFVAYFYALIGPLCRVMGAVGITPNVVTLGSLLLAIGGAVAIANSQFMIAVWLVVLASSADAMDGFLARAQGTGSPAGAFLDSFVDRLTEGVIFIGFAVLGDGGLLTVFAVVAAVTSFAVSYARARGESLGATGKVGIMQRPVRLVMVDMAIFALAIGEFAGGMWALRTVDVATGIIGLLGVAAGVTAARRAHLIYHELLPEAAGVETLHPEPSDDDLLEKVAS